MIWLSIYKPRPYQTECLTTLAKAREQGIKKGLVVMAGGLGKTMTAIFDADQYLGEHPNARFLYLCDQEIILIQNKKKFRDYFGEERSYGLYSSNSKTLHRVDFLFATLQSVRDHREVFPVDGYDYIIVDEAHHTSADTYEPVIWAFDAQFLLGLTATPDRKDGRSILDAYHHTLFEMDIYQGWAEGYLTPAQYELMLDDVDEKQLSAYLAPENAGLKVSMAQLNRTIFAPKRDEEIVASARERIASAGIKNPRIFAFCSNITYAESMAKHFGDGAAVVHSKQSRALNEAILSDFRSGKINTVLAVDMLNEGVDVPEANVLIFLRATDAKRIFFQQLARGLRLSEGKKFALVLDYVCNVERIAVILEMEENAKKRIQPPPTSASSPKQFSPITVNIPATKFRTRRVDIERLLGKIGILTKNEAIELLRDNSVNGAMPRRKFFDETPGLPWGSTIIRALGASDWGSAAAIAHLRLEDSAGSAMADDRQHKEYMSYHLRLYYESSLLAKHWLTVKEIDQNPELKSNAFYRNMFGPMAELRKKAIEVCCTSEDELKILTQGGRSISCSDGKRSSTRMSKEYLTDGIVKLTRELGHKPSGDDIDECQYLPTSSYVRHQLKMSLQELYVACNLDEVLESMGIHQIKKERRIAEPRNFVFDIHADGTFELLEHRKKAMQDFVRHNKRKLKKRDLCKANGLPSETSFRLVGLSMQQINDMIGADQILAELAQENN